MLWRAKPSKRRESESRVCYRLRAKTHRKGNAARAVTRFVHFVRPSRVGRAPRPTHALCFIHGAMAAATTCKPLSAPPMSWVDVYRHGRHCDGASSNGSLSVTSSVNE